MISLVRYEIALLLGSQRWLQPLMLFGFLILAGAAGGQQLSDSFGWCAAMLVPAVAWLTRSLVTAEPAASWAMLAAAQGARRIRLAVLITGLAAGLVLAVVGGAFEFVSSTVPHGMTGWMETRIVLNGAATEGICVLIGSAIGALCSPPLLRRPTISILVAFPVTVGSLVAPLSPANAAVRGETTSGDANAGLHLPVWPTLGSLAVAAMAWALSARYAARRDTLD